MGDGGYYDRGVSVGGICRFRDGAIPAEHRRREALPGTIPWARAGAIDRRSFAVHRVRLALLLGRSEHSHALVRGDSQYPDSDRRRLADIPSVLREIAPRARPVGFRTALAGRAADGRMHRRGRLDIDRIYLSPDNVGHISDPRAAYAFAGARPWGDRLRRTLQQRSV